MYLKKPIPQIKEGQLHAKHLTLCHTDTALSSPFSPPTFQPSYIAPSRGYRKLIPKRG